MKNEKLKKKNLVTARFDDIDFFCFDSLSQKFNLSYSKLLRVLVGSYYLRVFCSKNEDE